MADFDSSTYAPFMMPGETNDRIGLGESGDPEDWVCVCNNRPDTDGFYACDEDGNEVEPVEGWGGLYFCARCERIIQQDTLELVGFRQVGATNLTQCRKCNDFGVIGTDPGPNEGCWESDILCDCPMGAWADQRDIESQYRV